MDNNLINIYCDESCHLEKDDSNIMVIGGIWCPKIKVRYISDKIKKLKIKHNIQPHFEIKWTKVAINKIDFYLELLKFFFEEDLHFRCLIVSDKSKLRHKDFNQDHNLFYDKMYYLMLCNIIDTSKSYNIYIDIKDTHTNKKSVKLLEYLRNTYKDNNGTIIKKIQPVSSNEIQIMQLTDIFIGIISYANRELQTSNAKLQLVKELKEKSGLSLTCSTSYFSKKINIFVWNPL